MNSQQDDQQNVVWVVLVGVILLAISLALGFGVSRSRHKAVPVALAVPVAAAEAVDGARVTVENGVVKFYFATGKADVAAGASEALAEVVKAVAAGHKAVISGFHDSTGDAAMNAELAKQRALAVREALLALGVEEGKIELRKPEQLEGTGSLAEARRVEVVVQ